MQPNPTAGANGKKDSRAHRGGVADLPDLAALLSGIAAVPQVLRLLEDQGRELANLREEIKSLHNTSRETPDGWLDAAGAAAYLSMSPGTFDKYRYQTTPRLKGHKVGGKTLYKRADLDNFVMLFEVKSAGLA